MNVEQLDIRGHLAQFAPFDSLPDELLDRVAGAVEIRYFQAGSELLVKDQPIDSLWYIRSGAVEMYQRSGRLFNRLGEGDIFGYSDLLRNRRVRYPVNAIEDTLIYFVPADVFESICDEDDTFSEFVDTGGRLKVTVEQQRDDSGLMTTRVRKLITRQPQMVESTTTLQAAAQRMRDANATCVLVVDVTDTHSAYTFTGRDGRHWQLTGILTDRDFCTRVLAEGLSPETPVGEVMSSRVIVIQSDESVYEGMLCMLRNQVHHLPVLHRRQPMGVLHLSDIVRHETHSSLFLVNNIFVQNTPEQLARLSTEVRTGFVRMVADGANSEMISRALATIGRGFTQRLLELAESQLGPAPIPYCFMVLGSMAREEPTINADQDNALVLDDSYDPERHGEYFEALAHFVCDGLNACGYPYCKGDVMATNPRWRKPLSVWKRYFLEWMDEPNGERLLHSSIFFDLAPVHGEAPMVETLQDLIAETAPRRQLFLAALARNARNRTPPLGFFRQFVMEQDGEHRKSINLKRRGTAPLTDLVRVHALACGSKAQNTFARLDDIAETKLLGEGVNEKLRYAFEFLSMVRIRHQAEAIEHGAEPDNGVDPEHVGSRDRHHLKDAFEAISNAQKFLSFRYTMPGRSSSSTGSSSKSASSHDGATRKEGR
ncbi:putative nucleotidyltransferase substrate binding domain-containing protein [Salinicola rhizosphaerae]|uniref:Cyclic nucleotide-binding protein n=1 Tax=Salinicola rhizosphaerae TaxID=1443141 RepID=A0ABQ3E1Y1_9GAMM|nr:putative nucleotidyltransferase substrate binding domain-containing protein [Salinicola rhizosphaerae]GHB23629.1 cyclic nucleotide-binding protein [Salinicola rhizosphaerae]